ncbi:MAG: phosphoribosylglycinamide formyltransferase 2 [Euryarchaeota archaeon]|nr:phosphoribosylglycinamide formyltransferase 2 [Euryarchaeota archaeon]
MGLVFGTPGTKEGFKMMLLGSGELGREIAIEAIRLGAEVIAVDRYDGAPAMAVAHRKYVGNMKDPYFLERIVRLEDPDAIVPEIEAINLDKLFDFEKEGYFVVPNAKATWIAMHRERIRETLVREAKVPTSRYTYATTLEELKEACEKIGYPCHTKAIMSSSGKGSYFVKGPEDVEKAWHEAKTKARGSADKIIVEEHIDFDVEITVLTVRYKDGGRTETAFIEPVGHYQIHGDYHSSWIPSGISDKARKRAFEYAKRVAEVLGGLGIFGIEMFVKGDQVWVNEVSPRPHDTGLVTVISNPQGFSEFALHAKAIMGLPIYAEEENGFKVIRPLTPAASHVIKGYVKGVLPRYRNIELALSEGRVSVHIFGKPEVYEGRRLGVVLAAADDVERAKILAERAAHRIEVMIGERWHNQEYELEKHILR